jgi:murein DD-endopeptidase MepM/ murein hydrolase activator NlpD
MAKRLTFMVIPEGGEKVFSRNMPAGLFKLFIVLIAIWIVFLIGITVVYTRLSIQASKSAMLENENHRLLEYFARVVDIEKSFKKNQELTARLAEMAGVNLNDLNSQPKINFDSLNSPGIDTGNYAKSVAKTDSALTPEQLSQQHIPYGRPLYGWITRTFGAQGDSNGEKHSGIDLAIKEGTAVSATASGTVISAGWDDYLGNFVVIDHENGYLTTYGHNKELLVKKGEKVTRGEVIALSGNTGHSSAPHLHYEILKNGVPIDPAPFLD